MCQLVLIYSVLFHTLPKEFHSTVCVAYYPEIPKNTEFKQIYLPRHTGESLRLCGSTVSNGLPIAFMENKRKSEKRGPISMRATEDMDSIPGATRVTVHPIQKAILWTQSL